MSDSKIILTYKDDDGNYREESVWATKKEHYFQINNIPFFATNIALGDVVSAQRDSNALYFDDLIKPSGHSTIQIIFFNMDEMTQVEKDLEEFGCTWEGSHIKTLIAVDVPPEITYPILKKYLDTGEMENRWSYREACLSDEHN